MDIKKKLILDDLNNVVAVQLDIDVFEHIENILENHGLVELMKENDHEDVISHEEAKQILRKNLES